MSTLKTLNRELRTAEAQANTARARILVEKTQIIREKLIRCLHCKSVHQLQRWSFLQDNRNASPNESSDADSWTAKETVLSHIGCPKCGKWNSICDHQKRSAIVDLLENYAVDKMNIFALVYAKFDDLIELVGAE